MTRTTTPAARGALRRRTAEMLRTRLAPPPKLTVSEWADRHRYLSPEASAEPGKWHTERAPYLRGIMDACSEPLIETVVVMSGSQLGKTEFLLNVTGFYADQDPSPILAIQPTVETAKAWSTDRLAAMLRDSPRLRGKVRDPRTRDSGNTILHKVFPGGHITVVGANSPAGLRMRPIRIVLADEVDAYPPSAGTEGDPVNLAIRRTATFWNRKVILTSSPTIKGLSRIESAFLSGDQRHFHVPCPDCGHRQPLVWAQLKWESGQPETARYACLGCGVLIDESQKTRLLAGGVWIAEQPGRRTASFALNALYSPWFRWEEAVRFFLQAKDNPEQLRVFVNTILGEPWEERGEQLSEQGLALRRETYGAEIPAGVGLLTAGVDVQGDRLEILVVGWGAAEESWRIGWRQLWGDPALESTWAQLEAELGRAYRHEKGGEMRIAAACIDSGGLHTEHVYRYVRTRQGRRIFATKGLAQPGRPLLGRPSRANRMGVRLFPVGTDTAKDLLFARLRIQAPGPGYWHFPETFDVEYFLQLTAEKVVTRYYKGRPVRRYEKLRPRNEALDLEVENLAALAALGPAALRDLGVLAERAGATGAAPLPPAPVRQDPMLQQLRRPGRMGGGWVSSWRS